MEDNKNSVKISKNQVVISFEVDLDFFKSEIKPFLDDLQILFKKQQKNRDTYIGDLSDFVTPFIFVPNSKEDAIKVTPTEIKRILDDLSGRDNDIKVVGSTMKSLGFVKNVQRIDNIPKHCYLIQFSERLERFWKAQKDDVEILGVRVRDFSNPDKFNEFVKMKNI